MTRAEKISLLQRIASGELPAAALYGPQPPIVASECSPGQYRINDGRIVSAAELVALEERREAINRHFPYQDHLPSLIFKRCDA